MKKHLWKIIAAIVLILVFTNPSQYDFKQYVVLKTGLTPQRVKCARTHYYLIFSIYEYNVKVDKNILHGKYYGVMKNFYTIIEYSEKRTDIYNP